MEGTPLLSTCLGVYQWSALGVYTFQSLCCTDPASSLTFRNIYYGLFPNKVVRTDEQCYHNIICNSESKWDVVSVSIRRDSSAQSTVLCHGPLGSI